MRFPIENDNDNVGMQLMQAKLQCLMQADAQ